MNRRPNLIPAAVFIVIGLSLGGYGAWQLRQAASRYQATAAVRVTRDQAELAKLPAAVADSVFQQTQAEVARSEAVLQKVVTKLDLAPLWAKSATPAHSIALAAEQLRERVTVTLPPGSALLQITTIGDNAAQALALANALAAAFCEVRQERRQQAWQAALDTIADPLRENEAKFQRATERVAQARAALDPAVRHLESPPLPSESNELRALRQESAQLTMVVMVQSNQLVRSQSLPAADLEKHTAQFTRTTNHVNELEAAIQAELQKQEALKNFWDAQQELDQVNIVYAPLKKAMVEQLSAAEAINNLPAIVAEPAESAVKTPVRSPVAFGCLIGAVVLLLGGAKLLGPGGTAKVAV
ncbi:MAG: hypothetical protein QM813_27865 [Verrucomicrobiota bacterium]